MSEKKVMGRPKKDPSAPTEAETIGLYKKHVRACTLRAKGYTQFDAYCDSHKVSDEDKVEDKGRIEDKVYKLFKRPRVRAYLKELLAAKTLEDIISRAEWLLSLKDDIQSAREAENWAAVMNGQRQAGQAVAALREGLVEVKDDAARVREIIEAFSGDDPERRKLIEGIMGKAGPDGEVFAPTLVIDNKKASDK